MRNIFLSSLLWAAALASAADDPAPFEAGAAREDITPPSGLPMWGYGARKDIPCQGTLDPLTATAVVIRAGSERLAIVGLDLGRSPARATLAWIREEVKATAGVQHVILVGSHTHHGPCLELEKPGTNNSTAATAEYIRVLREKIASAIIKAAKGLRPARLGASSAEVKLNRNRHTKIEPKPVDRRLGVLRLDDLDGKPIAILVNFTAHPTTREAALLKWSPDYPAALRATVEKEMGGLCAFLQGASGDQSAHRHDPETDASLDTDAFGAKVGEAAVRIARGITTVAPGERSIKVRE